MVGQVIGFQRPRWTPTYTEKRPGDTRGESTFDNKNTMGRRREELGLGGPGVAAGKDHRLGRTFVGRVDKKNCNSGSSGACEELHLQASGRS